MDATPLMQAVVGSYLPAAKLFLKRGANATLRDSKGQSARDFAIKRKQTELISLLP